MSLFDYYHAIPAPSAVLTYAQTLIAMAPTAYWRLGESSGNAADSSGNGYTLTAGGSPTYSAAGWANGGDTAITFDVDWFTASDAAWMDIGTGDWSVSWCMKRSGTPATQMQIARPRWAGQCRGMGGPTVHVGRCHPHPHRRRLLHHAYGHAL